MKHNTDELHRMVQHVSSSEDLAELSQSAAAAKQTGATLAARQAEVLESVSQELLCSPEIIRCSLPAAWCIACPQKEGCHLTGVRSVLALWEACHLLHSTCSLGTHRQGEMAQWVPQKQQWNSLHFILTRAGFLHWCQSFEEPRPLDCLNLVRCQFQAGEAPILNLIESSNHALNLFGHKTRIISLKANSIEDCCEWAIGLREAIAKATGRTPD